MGALLGHKNTIIILQSGHQYWACISWYNYQMWMQSRIRINRPAKYSEVVAGNVIIPLFLMPSRCIPDVIYLLLWLLRFGFLYIHLRCRVRTTSPLHVLHLLLWCSFNCCSLFRFILGLTTIQELLEEIRKSFHLSLGEERTNRFLVIALFSLLSERVGTIDFRWLPC